ncbi:MAG: hypothetical protein KJ558_12420 [Gammaproteobacteria bacterium]|nr:hypothetical protein [Gammaproteobacteria bacterium]MBU1655607.1 hypothetical protein [Gammaproteobacteria bacterium]MBU1962279.1 hypothetical protein [Gammaproteobacteria bacterium]
MSAAEQDKQGMRLDKWLWAARFFKTRKLAVEAVNGGKVQVNGQRAKPGREIHSGTALQISIGALAWDIRVAQLPAQRRPAAEAIHFYEEGEESRDRRQALIAEQRLLRGAQPLHTEGRPNKRDRRLIHRFKQGA